MESMMWQVVGGTAGSFGLWVYDIPTQTYTLYQYSKGGFGLNTTATGINNTGVVVGYTEGNGGTIGLVLRGSTFKPMRIPGSTFTQLTSINNAGAIIAVTVKSGSETSYLLQDNGNLTQITIPGQPTAYALAISDSNALAGNYFVAHARDSAFEWQRKGLFKPINEPNIADTFANGINGGGQVVGYFLDSSFNSHGFLWTPPADAAKK